MDIIVAFLILFGVILEIWLIVRFVKMTSDVRKIREKVYDNLDSVKYSVANAKLDVLLHREDTAYQAVIEKIFNYLHELTTVRAHEIYYNEAAVTAVVEKKVNTGRMICAILGRPFPDELSSIKAFKAYIEALPEI